ncbi:MAG: hypothetical protein ACPG6X_00220 [Synechococcus sp.]
MKPAFDLTIVHDARRYWRLLISCVLSVCLVSCSPSSGPPRSVVLDALALQIELTQTSIAQTLELPPMAGHPSVSRVRIEDQSALKMAGHRGVHLQGRFDWQLPGDKIQVDSPFDLYLEQGDKQQSWRLAQPIDPMDSSNAVEQWMSYPLPLA